MGWYSRIAGAGSFLPFPPNLQPNISVQTSALQPGEEKIIADRLFSSFSKPPMIKRGTRRGCF